MIEVSIIVPIYKVEAYLERCVSSLMNQTLKNIEIILVDDGSPDNCPYLCDSFEKKDKRVKVVHKTNGGLSSARNAGMTIASGKYIGFVDSDDDIELDMYERMFEIAVKYQTDFVMCDYIRRLSDGNSYHKSLNIEPGYYDKNKIIKHIYPKLIMNNDIDYGPLLSVWHCLYNRKFLEDNHLCFDEDVKWSEDNIFSSKVGYCANNFYYMKDVSLYHYYQNENTITTSYRKGAWDVYKLMNNYIHQYFDSISEYDFTNQMYLHLIYYASNCIGLSVNKINLNEISNEIKSILSDDDLIIALKNVKNLNVSKRMRFQLWLMKHQHNLILALMVKRRNH
ncbi:MAG: glycosyltransferase [Erysipelotrichaceae bacterium]|nr:glycosyltransferase [Erysipelotrichaceae bacterium]